MVICLFSLTFPLGTVAGGLALYARGRVHRKGAAQLGALACGSLALGVISLGLPFQLALLAVFAWGICGSVFMAAGRTVFQEEAPEHERARVLAVYTMGFMGSGGLLGAPLAGLLAHAVGPLNALGVNAVAMLATVGLLAALTPILRVR